MAVFCYPKYLVFIKILYALLVLCMIALVGAVGAAYVKIRRHMKGSDKALRKALHEIEEEKTGTRTGV